MEAHLPTGVPHVETQLTAGETAAQKPIHTVEEAHDINDLPPVKDAEAAERKISTGKKLLKYTVVGAALGAVAITAVVLIGLAATTGGGLAVALAAIHPMGWLLAIGGGAGLALITAAIQALRERWNRPKGPSTNQTTNEGSHEFTSTVTPHTERRPIGTALALRMMNLFMPTALSEEIRKMTRNDDEENVQRAAQTRANFRAIGATPVTIHTSDGAKLDGSYISVDGFLQKLKEAGGQRFSVAGTEPPVSGFVVPNAKATELAKTLGDLGGFQSRTEGNNTYFYAAGTALPANFSQSAKLSEIDTTPNPNRGTVLLTMAAAGTYEANKREIMSLLARGLNVMVFNYREYGQSKGPVSDVSFKRDIDAAYDYLHTVHALKPENLIIKSMCLSGDAGTYLAAKHPGANLFLDQTYSDARGFLARVARDNIPRGWKANLAAWLVRKVIPPWVVKDKIAGVTGRVALVATSDDADVPNDETLENLQPLLEREDAKRSWWSRLFADKPKDGLQDQGSHSKQHNVTLYAMPGRHVQNWLTAGFNPSDAAKFNRFGEEITDSSLSEPEKTSLSTKFTQAHAAYKDKLKDGIDKLEALRRECQSLLKTATGLKTRQMLIELDREANDIILTLRLGKESLDVPQNPGHMIMDQFLRRLNIHRGV